MRTYDSNDDTVAGLSMIWLRLPAGLVDEIDALARKETLTRTAWLRRTLNCLVQLERGERAR